MKGNWIQLIDTIEKDPFETEAFFALHGGGEELGIADRPDELCHGTCGAEDVAIDSVGCV